MNLNIAPLSPPPTFSTVSYLFLAIIILSAILGVAFLALKHAKLRKPLAIAVAVMLAVTAGAYAVWAAEASIDYWLISSDTYPTGGENSVIIHCENNGHLTGTVRLNIEFRFAQFSNKTSPPFQQIDNQTAQFTYTLQPGEKQKTQAYFTISNTTDFYIRLYVENGDFLSRYNSNGVNYVSYGKALSAESYIRRVVAPPA